MRAWRGRADSDGADAHRWHQVVVPYRPGSPAGLVLLGFAVDEGVRRNHGRPGAAEGPAVLRRAMANLPCNRSLPLYDAGTITCPDGELEAAQQRFAGQAARLLADGQTVLGLGGGHEIAFASVLGLVDSLAPEARPRMGVLNFDAHFDLRRAARASSGTSFQQAAELCRDRGLAFRYCCLGVSESANTPALFRRAGEMGAHWRRDNEMTLRHLDETLTTLDEFLAGIDILFLTVCLDVLPGSVAPGVSAPAARGVSLEVIEPLIDRAAASGLLRIADIAELNPALDRDGLTARVAARLVHRIAQHLPGPSGPDAPNRTERDLSCPSRSSLSPVS